MINSATIRVLATLALVLPVTLSTAAHAASCGSSGAGFGPWLANFKRQAAAQGLSQHAIGAGLDGITYDARIVRLDRNQ